MHFYRNVSDVFYDIFCRSRIWDKVFANGSSKICGRQPVKYLKFKFLKAVFSKFNLIHSWKISPILSFFGFSFALAANKMSEWFCDGVTLRVNYKGQNYILNASCGGEIAKGQKIWPFSGPVEIIVPKRYSYACSNLTFSLNDEYRLEISGMQV